MYLESVEPHEVNDNTKYVTTPDSAKPPDDGTYKRVLLSVVAVCALVFVASMVVLAISHGVQTGSLSTTGREEKLSRDIRQDTGGWGKTWMLAVGHDFGAYEYINSTGHIVGFLRDLVREVCAAAGIRCATVWDKYTNCVDSEAGLHNQGGKGLMGKWYDACSGWMATITRIHIFDFSVAFTIQAPVNFFTKPGDTNFNPKDIRGKTIVFMDGWAGDEKCLAWQRGIKGNILPKPQILHVFSTQEFYDAIINSTAAAGFSTDDAVRKYIASGQLKQVGPSRKCGLSGNAMMTRKVSTFNTHWNRGFEIIYSNGRYKQLCDSVTTKYGGQGHVTCIGV